MRILSRTAVLLALTATVAGCGAYHLPGSSQSVTGAVSGQVIAVPCAPVENQENPCNGHPVPGLLIEFRSGAGAVQSTKTDSGGSYTVQLDPGTWTVSIKGMRVLNGPPSVTVTAGARVLANYSVDSGIRMPAPAAQTKAEL